MLREEPDRVADGVDRCVDPCGHIGHDEPRRCVRGHPTGVDCLVDGCAHAALGERLFGGVSHHVLRQFTQLRTGFAGAVVVGSKTVEIRVYQFEQSLPTVPR
jgi:hypothetical protein